MSADDEDKDKKTKLHRDDEKTEDESGQTGESGESGDSGQGGQAGQVEFRDFLASDQHLREDLLPDEKRRLLSVHSGLNEANVKKQKTKRDQYKALKEGKTKLQDYRQGLTGTGANSPYRPHRILANKAQFSGIDRQVNALPNENVADTNEADRNELEQQYRLRYQPEMQPKFHPKPSGPI